MLVDRITFTDPKTGHYITFEVIMDGQPKLRVWTSDSQQMYLTIDQTRAMQSALSRVLEGR